VNVPTKTINANFSIAYFLMKENLMLSIIAEAVSVEVKEQVVSS
jgi:hypothetical protein